MYYPTVVFYTAKSFYPFFHKGLKSITLNFYRTHRYIAR